jgi:hypothetical protein
MSKEADRPGRNSHTSSFAGSEDLEVHERELGSHFCVVGRCVGDAIRHVIVEVR